MLWHMILSSVPASSILSVGSGTGAVEQCSPMAGPAAPWLPCSDWPCTSPTARLPLDDPLFCLRRQTGLSNSTQGHFKNCISSCAIGFLCHSWRSLSPGTACCPAALAGHLTRISLPAIESHFSKTICRMGGIITSSMDVAELCRGTVGIHEYNYC